MLRRSGVHYRHLSDTKSKRQSLMNAALPKTRPAAPSKFFMSLRDISFWIRSAKTDSLLKRLRHEHGNEEAFDRLYQTLPDPWFAGMTQYRYQPLKYQVVLSLLPDRVYHRALDIGCGVGIFSRLLAQRADQVVGIDISQSAVDYAARTSAAVSNVEFRQADLLKLDSASLGQFDLVVLADTIYYLPDLSDRGLQAAREQVLNMLAPGGTLLLVNHYFFQLDSHSRMTRSIHTCFQWANGMRLESQHRRPFYLVSVLEREKLPA
jgi:SAM-dependent methyltransferase